ncbi:MAG TPA: hypothetical protein V6D43_24615 [Candidatus Sericytochromatia bacterium]
MLAQRGVKPKAIAPASAQVGGLEGWKVVSAAGREAEGYSASVSPGWKNLVIYQPVNL